MSTHGPKRRWPTAAERRALVWPNKPIHSFTKGAQSSGIAASIDGLFSVYRSPFETTDDRLDFLKDRLNTPRLRGVKLFNDMKLSLITPKESKKVTTGGLGLERGRTAAERVSAELPQMLEGCLGEAAIFGANRSQDEGTRFVGLRLDFETGKMIKGERRMVLEAIGCTSVNRYVNRHFDPHISLLATRHHSLALEAQHLLLEVLEQPIPITFGPAEVISW
jgi:hypothetical protein